eukprot:6738648-Pyramimonas_sp.AAC.1
MVEAGCRSSELMEVGCLWVEVEVEGRMLEVEGRMLDYSTLEPRVRFARLGSSPAHGAVMKRRS